MQRCWRGVPSMTINQKHFTTEDSEVTGEKSYSFSLQATHLRPKAVGWRKAQRAQHDYK